MKPRPPVIYGAKRPNGKRPVNVSKPPPAKFVFAARPTPSMPTPKYRLQKYFTSAPPPQTSSRANNWFLLTRPILTRSFGLKFRGSLEEITKRVVQKTLRTVSFVTSVSGKNGSSFGTLNCPVSAAKSYERQMLRDHC